MTSKAQAKVGRLDEAVMGDESSGHLRPQIETSKGEKANVQCRMACFELFTVVIRQWVRSKLLGAPEPSPSSFQGGLSRIVKCNQSCGGYGPSGLIYSNKG